MNKKSLAQQTADNIYELIAAEEVFHAGDRLPGENILAPQLNVSRNTLREAIKILVSQGVLKVYRGKGTFVSDDISRKDGYDFVQIERMKAQLRDLYEVRLLIEPEAAALASIRATDDEMEQIIILADEAKEQIYTNERAQTEQDFHNAIIRASHNEFLMQLTPIINNAIKDALFIGADINSQLSALTLSDHPLIIDFLKKRDPIGAKQAVSIHLRRVIDTLNLDHGEHPII